MPLVLGLALALPLPLAAQTPGSPGTIFGDPPRSPTERREPQRPFEPLRKDLPVYDPTLQPPDILESPDGANAPIAPSPEAGQPDAQKFSPPAFGSTLDERFDGEPLRTDPLVDEPLIEGGTPETMIPGLAPGARPPETQPQIVDPEGMEPESIQPEAVEEDLLPQPQGGAITEPARPVEDGVPDTLDGMDGLPEVEPGTVPEVIIPDTQIPGEPPTSLPSPPIRRENPAMPGSQVPGAGMPESAQPGGSDVPEPDAGQDGRYDTF